MDRVTELAFAIADDSSFSTIKSATAIHKRTTRGLWYSLAITFLVTEFYFGSEPAVAWVRWSSLGHKCRRDSALSCQPLGSIIGHASPAAHRAPGINRALERVHGLGCWGSRVTGWRR
jgi:hypothetical protein